MVTHWPGPNGVTVSRRPCTSRVERAYRTLNIALMKPECDYYPRSLNEAKTVLHHLLLSRRRVNLILLHVRVRTCPSVYRAIKRKKRWENSPPHMRVLRPPTYLTSKDYLKYSIYPLSTCAICFSSFRTSNPKNGSPDNVVQFC